MHVEPEHCAEPSARAFLSQALTSLCAGSTPSDKQVSRRESHRVQTGSSKQYLPWWRGRPGFVCPAWRLLCPTLEVALQEGWKPAPTGNSVWISSNGVEGSKCSEEPGAWTEELQAWTTGWGLDMAMLTQVTQAALDLSSNSVPGLVHALPLVLLPKATSGPSPALVRGCAQAQCHWARCVKLSEGKEMQFF